MKRLTLFYLILITIISLFGVKALFHSGFYTSHDGEHQVLRLYHFDKAVKDNQIPPRWANYQMLNGHGYPLFIFSYHAPWIIGEPLKLIGLSLTDTVKAIFILTYLFSGLLMFLWLKKIFGRLPAFVGSILYLWAPYRFSNIFVRASLGEATAFMFVPLVFYGLDQINEKKNFKGILIGGFGFCGLILSHAMTTAVFVFPVLVYLLVNLLLSKRKALFLKRAVLLFLLGFSLSAYYILPAFFEKKYTKFSQIFPLLFADHFVTLKQLVYSRWGYGFSFPGIENDGMAFQIGISHWLSLFFTVVLMAGLFLVRKKVKIPEKSIVFKAIGFVLSFLFSLLMMIKMSSPIWKFFTKFIPFDFPWRFLGLSVFSLSFLSGFAIWLTERIIGKKPALLICLSLLVLTFYGNRNHLRVNQYIYHDDSHYEKITNSTTSYDEFLPIWVQGQIVDQKKGEVEILQGKALIKDLKRKSDKISFKIDNQRKETLLRINTLFFPGWKLFANGKKQDFDFKKSGLIEFSPPIDRSEVLLIFTKTPIRVIGDVISFSALAFLVLWLLKFRWQ